MNPDQVDAGTRIPLPTITTCLKSIHRNDEVLRQAKKRGFNRAPKHSAR